MTDKEYQAGCLLTLISIRGALIRRGVLSQQDLDDQADGIFANVAIDRAVGHMLPGLAVNDFGEIEWLVRGILHPPEPKRGGAI
jgi:hypothetical protein